MESDHAPKGMKGRNQRFPNEDKLRAEGKRLLLSKNHDFLQALRSKAAQNPKQDSLAISL